MSKKKIQALVPKALGLVEKHLAENGNIPRVYNGYIASMGAAMKQSGLLPTLAIFSAKSESSGGDKRKLMRVLTSLLLDMETQDQFYHGLRPEENQALPDDGLLRFASETYKEVPDRLRRIRRDLEDASIAVKLCLRTFNLVDNDNE